MSASIDWVEIDPDDPAWQPTYGPPCGALIDHTWTLTIQEGDMCLDSGCPECNDVVLALMGGKDVEMAAEIKGKLKSHLETIRGFDFVEYDHWWEFIPDV